MSIVRHIVNLTGDVHRIPLFFYRWNAIFRKIEEDQYYELIDEEGNHNGDLYEDITTLIVHSFYHPLIFRSGPGRSLLVCPCPSSSSPRID